MPALDAIRARTRSSRATAALAYASTAQVSAAVAGWSEDRLREAFGHDPWLENYILSVWERDQGRPVVSSHPWHQAFIVVEHCNARCGFCSYWLNEVSITERDFYEHMRPVMRYAKTLVLTGGEPTLHPELPGLLEDLVAWTDPRCFRSIITNGLRLPELVDDLVRLSYNACVSLNAGTPELHQKVMRLGTEAWPVVLDSIRRLKRAGRYVSVSYVVTATSLPDVPAFLAVCDELGVDLAYLRSPTPIGGGYVHWENYGDMSPSSHPDFERLRDAAVAAIAACRTPVDAHAEQWSVPTPIADTAATPARALRDLWRSERTHDRGRGASLAAGDPGLGTGAADMGDPYGRAAPLHCDHVYFSLESMTRSHRLEPCCFMPQVPEHETMGLMATADFMSLWNSPAMVHLRTRLTAGPLLPMCKVCTYHELGY